MESTPEEYLDTMLSLFDDIKLKLKDTGNCFVNMGDTYAGSGGADGDYNNGGLREGQPKFKQGKSNLKPKSLCMIPSRFAWRMIEHGWILRNEICWYKKNHMPESVTDRLTTAHETIYHFVKQRKYFYDLDAIREPFAESSIKRITQTNVMNQTGGVKQYKLRGNPQKGNASRHNKMVQSLACKYAIHNHEDLGSPRARSQRDKHSDNNSRTTNGLHENRWDEYFHQNGKNPGDVIEVDEEYTTSEIINRWKQMHPEDWNQPNDLWQINTTPYSGAHFAVFPIELVRRPILAGCPVGGHVLDPFGGSGTVAKFCRNNNRDCTIFELNPEYEVMINERAMLNYPELDSF